MPRVVYAKLAEMFRQLSMDATCEDLKQKLAVYFASDPDYCARAIGVLSGLPDDASWVQGLIEVCEFLRVDNPRFSSEIFCDEMVFGER